MTGFHEVPVESIQQTADRVGERIEHLCVGDVMSRWILQVAPDDSLQVVARKMLDHDIHRLPVTEEGRLLGIISSLDFVALCAEGRVKPAQSNLPRAAFALIP